MLILRRGIKINFLNPLYKSKKICIIIYSLLFQKADNPETLDFSGVFLIYANNGSKSALARDLGDCRDNKGKLAKRVFICLTGNFLLSKRARCANEMHLWKKKIGAGDRARREEKAVR